MPDLSDAQVLEALDLSIADLVRDGWAAHREPDGAGRWKLITDAPELLVRAYLAKHGRAIRRRGRLGTCVNGDGMRGCCWRCWPTCSRWSVAAALTAWGRYRGWPACPDPYDGRDLCPRGQPAPR